MCADRLVRRALAEYTSSLASSAAQEVRGLDVDRRDGSDYSECALYASRGNIAPGLCDFLNRMENDGMTRRRS